ADLDLGSIFAIAFAAKAGYLKGQIEVLKIGIDSPSFNLVLPLLLKSTTHHCRMHCRLWRRFEQR
ncbi:hypothetical protein, partial [Ralstonia solanacearum]